MGRESTRSVVVWGLGVALFGALIASCVLQTLIPPLVKLPGLLLCSGGELELVLRRRTSYGVCHAAEGAQRIGYVKLLLVSLACWWVVFAPLGIWGARSLARKRPQ